MNQDNYITLIYKKLKREISPDEQKSLDSWLVKDELNAQLQDQITENWQLSKTALPPITIDAKKDFQGFKKRMQAHKLETQAPKKAIVRPLKSRRRFLSIAAAIAIPLLAALWIFQPSPAPEMQFAETSIGETKSIQLADGTKITLNENSTLSYPAAFVADERAVILSGEGYFEVTSNPNQPFVVQTDKASVKVLGTVFNVRSIDKEEVIKVNVEEGKVQFSSTLVGKGVMLTAGEEGQFDLKTNEITERKVNHKNASAWKTKALTYKNAPLKTVMQDLAQHFKVNVAITNTTMQNCPITARFGEVTPTIVLDYIVEVYQMELKQINNQTYELINGVCQ